MCSSTASLSRTSATAAPFVAQVTIAGVHSAAGASCRLRRARAATAGHGAASSGRTSHDGLMRAFVLSGGASLGAIQVGMLEALFERGIAPDLIIGASVGAV